jgi:hypothetical protein
MKLCDCGCGQPAAIASSTDRSRGYVKGQPTRYKRGHGPGRRGARAATRPGNKVCARCDVEKPVAAFPIDHQRPDRLYSYCLECKAKVMREASRKYGATHRAKLRLKDRRNRLERLYGLSADAFMALLEAQDGACAICGLRMSDGDADHTSGSVRRANVDHCHKTGRIRGLLCNRCNTGLGQFSDDPEILRRAAAYLESGGPQPLQMRLPLNRSEHDPCGSGLAST